MRRLALNVCGVVAGLTVLTACGSANVPGQAAAPAQQPKTLADLAHLVSFQTSAQHTVHMRFDATTTAGSITGTGQADIDGAASKIAMDMSSPVGPIDIVLVGSSLYVKVPQDVAHSAKPWMKIDANGTDRTSKALAALVSQEQQTVDPSQTLQQIESAGRIDKVSKEQVDGQPVTHYLITVDTNKLMNSKLISPQMRQLISEMGTRMPPSVTYDLWMNGANLPVKIGLTEGVYVPKTNSTAKISIVMTYTQWGAPVSITVPPADEVGPPPAHN